MTTKWWSGWWVVGGRKCLLRLGLLGVVSFGVVTACARAESPPATTVAKLSADELCRRVPPAAVTQALGEAWERADDPAGGCRYQSRLRRTATLTVASTGLTADAFRRQASTRGGKASERDGVLIADFEGDGFGALDELWWNDGSGALILRADNEVTLDQALAVVTSSRRGVPGTTPGSSPGSTGSTEATEVPTTT